MRTGELKRAGVTSSPPQHTMSSSSGPNSGLRAFIGREEAPLHRVQGCKEGLGRMKRRSRSAAVLLRSLPLRALLQDRARLRDREHCARAWRSKSSPRFATYPCAHLRHVAQYLVAQDQDEAAQDFQVRRELHGRPLKLWIPRATVGSTSGKQEGCWYMCPITLLGRLLCENLHCTHVDAPILRVSISGEASHEWMRPRTP